MRKQTRHKRATKTRKTLSLAGLIQSNPSIMLGKPIIAGTRIPVDLILEKLAAGETVEQILNAHPRLTETGVRAALDFASKAIRADVLYPVTFQP